jgi:CubicO group peptidase (beta-lactamase class C family)
VASGNRNRFFRFFIAVFVISALLMSVPLSPVAAADVDITVAVTLQGSSRPDAGWAVPLTVKLFTPGANVESDVPLYEFTPNTTKDNLLATGQCAAAAGSYDVTTVSGHTLANVLRNVTVAQGDTVYMGALHEGDANDDGIVNISDFGILSVSFTKSTGQQGWDERADFDRNGIVNISDFGLLAANYMQTSCQEIPLGWDFSSVTDYVQQSILEPYCLEGASVLLIKDDRIIYEQYFGHYDLDTVVRIASASKWLAAATIMTLVDDGLLSLDDNVVDYLPSFSGDKSTITIRQCLSHISGMTDDTLFSSTTNITLADSVGIVAATPLDYPPGTYFDYGSNSFQTVGRVAEVVTGQSWEELFQARIATPLEMGNTSYLGNWYTRFPLLAGSGTGTLHDYGHFVEMLHNDGVYNGQQVLAADSVREMFRNQTLGTTNPTSRYGLGAWVRQWDAQNYALMIDSVGAYGFKGWVDAEAGIAGVFLTENRLSSYGSEISIMQTMIHDIVSLPASASMPPYAAPVIPSPAPSGPPALDIALTDMTAPVVRGDPVNITVTTTPGAKVLLWVTYPTGNRSTRPYGGDKYQIADGNGQVTWSWTMTTRGSINGAGHIEVYATTSEDADFLVEFRTNNLEATGYVTGTVMDAFRNGEVPVLSVNADTICKKYTFTLLAAD